MSSELDPTDIRILNLLQQNAKLEGRQIAGEVYKSASSVNERIRNLQRRGFIKRYVAVLDREKIGYPLLTVAQVSLSVHTKSSLLQFEEQMNKLPEVQSCLHLSGDSDFILHIAVPDIQYYHDFLVNKLCNLPHVAHVRTSFVLKECKTQSVYPLRHKA